VLRQVRKKPIAPIASSLGSADDIAAKYLHGDFEGDDEDGDDDDELLGLHPAALGPDGTASLMQQPAMPPPSSSSSSSSSAAGGGHGGSDGSAAPVAVEENPFGLSKEAAEALANRPKLKNVSLRMAAGEVWEDHKLEEWPENDFRLFVGHLSKDTTTAHLQKAFGHYPSLAKAYVPWSKRLRRSKGFGFVSFLDPRDALRAMEEMPGKYVGSAPCVVRRATLEERAGPQTRADKRDLKQMMDVFKRVDQKERKRRRTQFVSG